MSPIRCLCLFAGVDTRLKFTIEPSLGKNGFQQVNSQKILYTTTSLVLANTVRIIGLKGSVLLNYKSKRSVCSYLQWYDALKAVARLPTGIPKEWRKRVCCFNEVTCIKMDHMSPLSPTVQK